MSKNDARVAQLRLDIEAKKTALKNRSSRFVPVTNCSLELDGQRYNLNVLKQDEILLVGAKIQSLITAATALWGKADGVVVSGYKLEDWLTDLKSRIEVVSVKAEEAKLAQLDTQLKQLLSEDARTANALDDIAALLN